MTPEMWKRIFDENYAELPEHEQAALLERLRDEQPELAGEIESLLRQRGIDQLSLDAPPGLASADEAPSQSDSRNDAPATVEYVCEAESAIQAGIDSPAIRSTPKEPANIPASIGRYRIDGQLGQGGMGVIYRGRDPELDRYLAIKVLKEERKADTNIVAHFLEEGQMMARLQHPGIAPIHEIGELNDGRPFFAMKLIQGKTLAELLKNPPASGAASVRRGDKDDNQDAGAFGALTRPRSSADLPRFVGIFEQICQTLAYAHSEGVIHRDLKPANMMVGAFGEVQVMDWGLATVVDRESLAENCDDGGSRPIARERTQISVALGTPAYMAPEQARGENDQLDERCDVFGLGAILCVILTGEPPFFMPDRKRIFELARRGDLTDSFGRLDRCGADAELINLCKRCLAPNKDERFRDAGAVGEAVAKYQDEVRERLRQSELTIAASDAKATEEKRRRRTQKIAVTVVLVLLLTGVAGLAAGMYIVAQKNEQLTVAKKDAENKREQAETERKIAAAINYFLRYDLLGQTDVRRQAERLLVFRQQQAERLGQQADRPLQFPRATFQPNYNVTVRELLDRAATRLTPETIEKTFPKQKLLQAQILKTVGDAYLAIGKYDKSIAHLARARKRFERVLGADHNDTLTCVNSLAQGYQFCGDHSLALPLFEEMLKIRKVKLGADHRSTLSSKNNLADAYRAAGKVRLALRLHKETLNLRKARLGLDHPATLTSMSNLGLTYREAGDLKSALPLFEETLRLRIKKLGVDHPDTLTSMNTLAGAYADADKLDLALPLFKKALRLQSTILGATDVDTLITMNNLASAYQDAGQFGEAIRRFEQALKLSKSTIGPDHPNTLSTMSNLATAYQAGRKWSKALQFLKESLKLRKQKLGDQHPDTLQSMHNLAAFYHKLGDHERALPLYNATLKLERVKLSADHSLTLSTLSNLGDCYRVAGKPELGRPLLEEALKFRKQNLGAGHPDTLSSMNNLALCYYAIGNKESAITLFEDTLKLSKDELGANHSKTLNSMYNLGIAYQRAGRFEQAIKILADLSPRLKTRDRHYSESRNQLKHTGKLLAQEKLLPAVLNGGKTNPEEQLALASMCRYNLHRFRDAVTLYSAAFAASPDCANDLVQQRRFYAARAAVLAAAGKGRDASKIDLAEKAKLRRQGLDWLGAELNRYSKAIAAEPRQALLVQERLTVWQKEPDFKSVRDGKPLAAIAESERMGWQQLWAEVETLRKQARNSYTVTPIEGTLTDATPKQSHEVKLSTGKVYVIDMHSKQFDTYLKLLDANGKLLAENDDIDLKAKILNSRITFTPSANGFYRLIADSYKKKGRGQYDILIRAFPSSGKTPAIDPRPKRGNNKNPSPAVTPPKQGNEPPNTGKESDPCSLAYGSRHNIEIIRNPT